MASTATIELAIPSLPASLRKATAFKEMTKALLSVPVLCDGDTEVTFRKQNMEVKNKNNEIIIKGERDTESPLWIIPIIPTESINNNQNTGTYKMNQANSAYQQDTLPKLTAY